MSALTSEDIVEPVPDPIVPGNDGAVWEVFGLSTQVLEQDKDEQDKDEQENRVYR